MLAFLVLQFGALTRCTVMRDMGVPSGQDSLCADSKLGNVCSLEMTVFSSKTQGLSAASWNVPLLPASVPLLEGRMDRAPEPCCEWKGLRRRARGGSRQQ